MWSCLLSGPVVGVYLSPNQLFPYLPIDMILQDFRGLGPCMFWRQGFLEIDKK